MYRVKVISGRSLETNVTSTTSTLDTTTSNDDDKTYYLCVSDKEEEVKVTVGRKNTDLVLDGDKCVSRTHCALLYNKDDGWKVQDLGSKFGTFVWMSSKTTTRTSAASSETEDATTDDDERNCSIEKQMIRLKSGGSMALAEPTVESPIVVQCGPMGVSSVVVEAIRLEFCVSRISSSKASQLERLAQPIKAAITNVFGGTTTHLVTPDRTSTAKILSAWASRTPIVTMDYVQALVDLPLLTEAWPSPDDYAPPGTLPMDALDASLPRDCLKFYKVVLLQNHKQQMETESLMVAAGATVIRTYTWEDDTFFHHNFKDEGITCFIDTSTTRLRKRRQHLLLQKLYCITPTGVATAISTLGRLHDIHGTQIPISHSSHAFTSSSDHPTQSSQYSSNHNHDHHHLEEPPSLNNHPQENEHHPRPCLDSHKKEDASDPPISAIQTNTNAKSSKRVEPSNQSKDSTQQHSHPIQSPTTTTSVSHPPNTDSANNTKRKRLLQVSSDGWFQAAPQSRDNYKKQPLSSSNPDSMDGEPATTVYCKNMVRLTNVDYRAKQIRCTNEDGIVDFKKFVKNSIRKHHSITKIPMTSVLPKETERQRQLELSQQQLEQDHQAAEALFADFNNNNKQRNRMGGGIQNYFSPGNPRTGTRRIGNNPRIVGRGRS